MVSVVRAILYQRDLCTMDVLASLLDVYRSSIGNGIRETTPLLRQAGHIPTPGTAQAVAVAELDDRHDVQGVVDLPVARPGQPVADLIAGACVDRGGAVPGREVGFGGEPGDVTGLDQQPGRARGADPV
jgi:hypothetical protein